MAKHRLDTKFRRHHYRVVRSAHRWVRVWRDGTRVAVTP